MKLNQAQQVQTQIQEEKPGAYPAGKGVQLPTRVLAPRSDRKLRNRLFVSESYAHPAKLNLWALAPIVEAFTKPGDWIADPMSGSGTLAWAILLQRNVILRDVEERWVEVCRANTERLTREAGLLAGKFDVDRHDARKPWGFACDHLIFSPPYGCQSNNQNWTTPEKRKILEALSQRPGNQGSAWRSLLTGASLGRTGYMTFEYGNNQDQIGTFRGKRYWEAMSQIYTQAANSIRPGGNMVLILKDHIREGKRVETCLETISVCEALGFTFKERWVRKTGCVAIWQRKRKAEGLPVIEDEEVLVFNRRNS